VLGLRGVAKGVLPSHYDDLDSSKGAKGNIIEQTDRMKRRSQMEDLLNTGLDNTAKLAKAEKKISDAMKIVLSIKKVIDSGL
jgi:hypothetical protein